MSKLPIGVRILSLATAIRWFAWGLFEALLPLFLFTFGLSYVETGLLQASYHIMFLLALPIAGILADILAERTVILLGLFLYPLVSIGYYAAGTFGLVILALGARLLQGAAYAFEAVGRSAYFRAHTPKNRISSAFGHFNTVAHIGWILGMAVCFFIIKYLSIELLFLAIIPTTIITIFMLGKVPDKSVTLKAALKKRLKAGFYSSMLGEITRWGPGIRMIAVLTFFVGIIATVAEFFIPIFSFVQGSSLQQVVLIAIVLNTPWLFSNYLGKVADRQRVVWIFVSLAWIAGLLLILAIMKTYVWQLIVAFGIGTFLVLLQVSCDGISTFLSKRNHYGRMSSAMEGFADLGSIAGPVVFGFMVDSFGMATALANTAAVTITLLLILFAKRGTLKQGA